MTDVVEQPGEPSTGARDAVAGDATGRAADAGDDRPAGGQETGTEVPDAAERILEIRRRIDEIDNSLIALWQERAALSREVGAIRRAAGGTRLVLSREQQILEHFREALGADGTQFAMLLLRAGRGPL